MLDYIEIEDEHGVSKTVYWPMCPTPGCPNRICLSERLTTCWPCGHPEAVN